MFLGLKCVFVSPGKATSLRRLSLLYSPKVRRGDGSISLPGVCGRGGVRENTNYITLNPHATFRSLT